ncbi:MAG: aminotransferase class I/II-fold pyridoxal phosphate-dependent enzyme [Bacteroidetes bacterium]|nr:MAG: aminotransferase class I/II-fold pyridoxal phosphate-dependent enzyme [Bacteroidota bacterium]
MQGHRMPTKKRSFATRAIHGKKLHPFKGAVTLPIHQTSTYRFADSQDAVRYAKGDPSVYVYSRYHNPSVEDVEQKLALMNDADDAVLFASGMAAISTAVLSLVKAGDEIVSTPTLYGGTYRFFRDVLPLYGVTVRYAEAEDLSSIEALVSERTKLFYCESPTNPTVGIVDLAAALKHVRAAGRKRGVRIHAMVDNTFATCLFQSPLAMGYDSVVESATKYIGGHSDLLAGAAVGPAPFIKGVRHLAKYLGGTPDPFAAFLIGRSLKTFELRVRMQTDNALALAKRLERHPKVLRVLYPGLASHPGHAVAKRQMSGFGAMVLMEVKGGVKGAVRLCDALNVAVNAMSLGGVETLVSIPVYSSHVNMSAAELKRHGVTPGMVRISVGAEGIGDLIADFEQALRKV